MKILGRNNSFTTIWPATLNIVAVQVDSIDKGRNVRFEISQMSPSRKYILSAALMASAMQAPALADSWYPKTAEPYPGTTFHCALTALPADQPGINSTDREFFDHSCAVLLRCAQEKELMLTALSDNKGAQALARYERATKEQLDRLKTVVAPAGLESFKSDVDGAISLQMLFFQKAVKARQDGTDMKGAMAIPEGREASQKLFAAWDVFQKRYLIFWGGSTKDCIYHHLCAYDLF